MLTGVNLGLSEVVFSKGAEQTALTSFSLLYGAFFRISPFQCVISYTQDISIYRLYNQRSGNTYEDNELA